MQVSVQKQMISLRLHILLWGLLPLVPRRPRPPRRRPRPPRRRLCV